MERKLLLAIGLMVGLMVLSNVIFPPIPVPETTTPDSVTAEGASATGDPAEAADGAAVDESLQEDAAVLADRLAGEPAREAEPAALDTTAIPEAGRTIVVRSDLYEFRFDSRGARMVGATIRQFPNFAPERDTDGPVELFRDGDAMFGARVALGGDTVSLAGLVFTPSTGDIDVDASGAELSFSTPLGSAGVTYDITYRFRADDYRIDIEAGLRNIGDNGYTILFDLGHGLRTNEATTREDFGQMALVTRTRTGDISAERLGRLDPGEVQVVPDAPFSWAASKSKYFLAAIVSEEGGAGFGGALLEGTGEEASSRITVAAPVPAGSDGLRLIAFVGPQDHERLALIGQELQNVNPYGWRFLQWFIRPFGELVISVLVWMHGAFSLAYGWVLILFGVVTRVVLFPLYQMSMRSQMKQMALQPEIKRIQEKYKEDPPKLQQEMMKAYKEAGVSPLGGCLPMLLPFPILITLFFVFQNTIEFRGVPFLWLPDLSLKDPLYIVPLLMGGSMLLLNWIGQRGMETNQQMKMVTYVLPVVFTFMFAQFASGLNLYYAASNIASLPQQLYLSRERRAHQAKTRVKGGEGGGSSGVPPSKGEGSSGGGKPSQTPIGGKRGRKKG